MDLIPIISQRENTKYKAITEGLIRFYHENYQKEEDDDEDPMAEIILSPDFEVKNHKPLLLNPH